MKPKMLLILAGLALLFTCTEGLARQQVECSGRPEVCSFFQHFITVFNKRDWGQFRACFADDITVMFDSPMAPERKNGRAAVEKMFRPLFPDSGVAPAKDVFQLKPEDVLIQDLGQTAVISFHLRGSDEIARRSFVVRKREDKWEIVHIHASSFEIVQK